MRNPKKIAMMVSAAAVLALSLNYAGPVFASSTTTSPTITTEVSAPVGTTTTGPTPTQTVTPTTVETQKAVDPTVVVSPTPKDPAPVQTTAPTPTQEKVVTPGPSASPNPTPSQPAKPCAVTASITHTYDDKTNSGDITAKGEFCGKILIVFPTSWLYTNSNSIWPQNHPVYSVVKVDKAGLYHFSQMVDCGQGDIYATWSENPAFPTPSTVLTAANTGYKESFLSSYSKGPVTYMNAPLSCHTPPVTPVIKPVAAISSGECYYSADSGYSYKQITLTYDNSGSNQPVEFVVPAPYGSLSRTVPAGQTVVVHPQDGWEKGVSYQVTAGGKTFDLSVPAFASCKPVVPPATSVIPPNASANDVCGVANDSVYLPGKLVEGSTKTVTDKAGNSITVSESIVDGKGGYTAVDTTIKDGVHSAAVVFLPFKGLKISEPGTGSTYKLEKVGYTTIALWKFTFTNVPCPTGTPTPPPTTTTTPATTTTTTATITKSATAPKTLPFTGAGDITPAALTALTLMLIGVLLVSILAFVRRRKTNTEFE